MIVFFDPEPCEAQRFRPGDGNDGLALQGLRDVS
jgi:hypothetical protein